jgi:hypothetical protein
LEFDVIFGKGVDFGGDGCLVVWYEVVDGVDLGLIGMQQATTLIYTKPQVKALVIFAYIRGSR